MNEIYGQGITFNPKTCDEYCMPLRSFGDCGDCLNKVKNNTLTGLPVDFWTITAGSQLVDRVFITDLSSDFTISQSVSIPAGKYKVFYGFDCSIDFDLTLNVTGASPLQVFDTSLGDDSFGVGSITLTGSLSRTFELDFNTALPSRTIIPGYIYICDKDAYEPETEFKFQIPLTDTGDSLLDHASVNDGVVPIEGVLIGSNTGTLSVLETPASCPQVIEDDFFDGHINLTTTDNGHFWIKYDIASGAIPFSYNVDVANAVEIEYEVRTGVTAPPGDGSQRVTARTLSGELKTTFCNPAATDYFDVDISGGVVAYGGNCRLEYELTDLDTSAYKMWFIDTATLEDDTQYRLFFKNKNSTLTSVLITDESGTDILESSSDGISFDKIFQTGTLPGTKTITIRFDYDFFIETESSGWEDEILTDATLYKQAKYTVELQDEDNVAVFDLDESHGSSSETIGNTYNQNIEYTLNTNLLGAGNYSMVAFDDGDPDDLGVRSNCLCINDSHIGYKQITWTPANNKNVGSYLLDYSTYPTTKFIWLKCSIQDLDIQNERESYVQSNGFVNIAWSSVRNLYTLVIYPVPRHIREALSFAFQDIFYINGEAYQVIDDDAYSPVFTARYDNSIRVPVHKVGEFSVSRNV